MLPFHLGKWKLVSHGEFFGDNPSEAPKTELYDLSADLSESVDLAARNPGIVADLAGKLRLFGSWQRRGVTAYGEGRQGFKAPKDWVIEKE